MFKAILWDCDGCLIDSEYIACALSAKTLTEAGYPISTTDFIVRFCGQGKSHIFGTIANEIGYDIQTKFDPAKKAAAQKELFENELKAIDGIHAVLDACALPMAIASGSEHDRLELTLKLTGLYDRFQGRIFSASEVARGKPHPDIFLYAAEKLGVAPTDCLVIEDSLNGVTSGKAAGMTVFGFTGGSHVSDKKAHEETLLSLGADRVFHTMAALPPLMANWSTAHAA